MANEGGKAAAREKKREEKRAKKKSKVGGGGGKEKQKNPVIQEARARYTEELRKQGTADDQMKIKVKAHLKDVVKPVVNEAKTTAKSKNLKGVARRKYIEDTVRAKLGLQA